MKIKTAFANLLLLIRPLRFRQSAAGVVVDEVGAAWMYVACISLYVALAGAATYPGAIIAGIIWKKISQELYRSAFNWMAINSIFVVAWLFFVSLAIAYLLRLMFRGFNDHGEPSEVRFKVIGVNPGLVQISIPLQQILFDGENLFGDFHWRGRVFQLVKLRWFGDSAAGACAEIDPAVW